MAGAEADEIMDLEQLLAIDDAYQQDTIALVRFLKARGLKLDPESLKAYAVHLKGKGYAAATINKRLAGAKNRLRLAFRSCEQNLDVLARYAFDSALREVRGLKLNSKEIDPAKVPTLSEVREMIRSRSLCERVKLFIEFLTLTGVRVSEMTGIRLSDLRDGGRFISVRIVGKGAKERIVKIQNDVVKRIRAHFAGSVYLFETKKGNKYDRREVTAAIAQAGKEILDKKISAHKLRHCFATAQIRRTRKVKAVSVWLGHSSTAITQDMYLHEQLEEADLDLDLRSIARSNGRGRGESNLWRRGSKTVRPSLAKEKRNRDLRGERGGKDGKAARSNRNKDHSRDVPNQ